MKTFLRKIALYGFHVAVVRPILNWLVGVRYRHKHLLPDGPCLVVSNHNSHLDAAVLMTLFPLRRLPQVHPVAAADYFGSNWFMNTIAMLFMNGIPIERKPLRGQDPLASIAERLEQGESLIFFPEGSRGEAGVVARFRPGIGMLVRAVPGLLVVPVFLSGPERIWPRGEIVPVPLSIDANVGKPRCYPPDLDAREIAERVREDVLSLAPPPPPLPASRPAPPLRIAICGVDPQVRGELFRLAVARLGPIGRTVGVAEPLIEADAQGSREVARPMPVGPGARWVRLLARVFRTGGRFKGDRFVEMVERAQLDEVLDHGRDTRFLLVDGSAIVDLLASGEADFYRGMFDQAGLNHLVKYLAGEKRLPPGKWWTFIRRAPEVWLISVFKLARPPIPDVVIHVCSSIPRYMRRLRSAGGELQGHENEAFLGRLQDAYREVGAALQKRRRVGWLELDAEVESVEAMACRVVELGRDSQRSSGVEPD